MSTNYKQIKPLYLIGVILLLFLAVEDVFLMIQNHKLKSIISRLTTTANIQPLKPGDTLGTATVQSMSGEINKLAYDDPEISRLLFVFNTTCPHCERNLSKWNEIYSNNKNKLCKIAGISLYNTGQTSEWLKVNKVDYEIYSAAIDTSFNRKYRISSVPQTILITGSGIVKNIWIGEISAKEVDEINNLIAGNRTIK